MLEMYLELVMLQSIVTWSKNVSTNERTFNWKTTLSLPTMSCELTPQKQTNKNNFVLFTNNNNSNNNK